MLDERGIAFLRKTKADLNGLQRSSVMHLVRIFCGFIVVLAREYKHEATGLGRVFGRVKHELSNWKAEK